MAKGRFCQVPDEVSPIGAWFLKHQVQGSNDHGVLLDLLSER